MAIRFWRDKAANTGKPESDPDNITLRVVLLNERDKPHWPISKELENVTFHVNQLRYADRSSVRALLEQLAQNEAENGRLTYERNYDEKDRYSAPGDNFSAQVERGGRQIFERKCFYSAEPKPGVPDQFWELLQTAKSNDIEPGEGTKKTASAPAFLIPGFSGGLGK